MTDYKYGHGPFLECVKVKKDPIGVAPCLNCGKRREVRVCGKGALYQFCVGVSGCGNETWARERDMQVALVGRIKRYQPGKRQPVLAALAKLTGEPRREPEAQPPVTAPESVLLTDEQLKERAKPYGRPGGGAPKETAPDITQPPVAAPDLNRTQPPIAAPVPEIPPAEPAKPKEALFRFNPRKVF